jgi:hypothetical protein
MASDAGPAPEPLLAGEELAPDSPREVPRDGTARDVTRDPRDLTGLAMQVVLRAGEGPPPPRAPEVNVGAVEAARHRLETRMTVEASQTRARFVLSGAHVVPPGTELRARSDRYGHLVLWPGEGTYRVAGPGTLRALLGERRLDVAPVTPASVTRAGEGARRLNLHTRRVEIATRAAHATLELATVRDTGDGGALVCRLLLDLMNAPPSTPACAADEVPLHAELRWTTRGALTFEATSLSRRPDLQAADLATPPASLLAADSQLPWSPAEVALSRAELASLRSAPVEVPLPADAQAPLPDSGMSLFNGSDELQVAWIDGVPAAWLAPGARVLLPSLVHGRYAVQWRTFLGDDWEPPETVTVPGGSAAGAVHAP